MRFIIPDEDDFKDYFARDFPFGTTDKTVMDSDITKAYADAASNFNESLFGVQASFTIGYLNLAAHHLVMNLRASSQGVAGQYDWIVSSKSVGPSSIGITIPDRILENPSLAMLSKTNYGAKYIMLILPRLLGNMFTVCGATHP